jgi:hypothetical protein
VAEEAARAATGTSKHLADDMLPERIIVRNDLLPAQFLAGAARTTLSVVRLVVPQIDRGVRRKTLSGLRPASGLGTGWLILPSRGINFFSRAAFGCCSGWSSPLIMAEKTYW